MKNIFTLILAAFAISGTFAQTNPLIIAKNISLPKDSVETKYLLLSLNNLLIAKEKPNEENIYVYESQKIETFILLDEMNGIEKSTKFKDDFFYKPYLNNIINLNKTDYLIQISYVGINENAPILAASFELIAHKSNNVFLFSSPLLMNTKNWKTKKAGNNIFHYKSIINKSKVQEFNKLTMIFDKKLKSRNKITEFYCCKNLLEMLKLIGVNYKLKYNGMEESVFNSSFGDKKIVVLGNNKEEFNEFDPHDTWHDRLYSITSRSKINRPVDEGCAYVYGGGSWGISWKNVFKKFKDKVALDKNTDWKECKEKPFNFNTPEIYLYVDYVVNALLIQKIEKEKGFAGVWELLNVGAFEKGNEKYYQKLEKLTGISKTNYNEKVWELINNEK